MTERKILSFRDLPSTNLKLRELLQSGCTLAHGTVITADSQSAGRGRLGRSFFSPSGAGLYMSYLITSITAEDMQYYTSWAAVAAARAIESLVGEARVGIKWVNDLVLGGRKICGILAESVVTESGARSVIVGIGVNVLGARDSFPVELADKASSIEAETGVRISKDELLRLIADELDELSHMTDERRQLMLREYKARCISLERDVTVISPQGARAAYAVAISDDYDLIVQYPSGELCALSSGEISIRLDDGRYI